MKKNIKSFLAMSLCAAMTISSSIVPTLASTYVSPLSPCEYNASEAFANYTENGIYSYKCPNTGVIYTIAVYQDVNGNTVRTILDGEGNAHPEAFASGVLPNEDGYYHEKTKRLTIGGLATLETLKNMFPEKTEAQLTAELMASDEENCYFEYVYENIYVNPCTLVDGVYTNCPPLIGDEEQGSHFNEVSKLMLTNATVTALFDRPYKDHGFMDNYLSYVSESIEAYFCPTLGVDLYSGSAAGYNKILVNNRVVQIPVGTTMAVPAKTSLEMRYLSGDGSSIESLQTSDLKNFSLTSVIYNLASNNIIGHFYPQIIGDYKYVTFKDTGMYTLYAQATPEFETDIVNGQEFYTSAQFSLMLQYSVILVVSNEGLPFSWYLPGDNNYNYIGTVVSPVVGSVAIPSTGIMHTVEEGDTLYSLAKTYYGSELFVNKVYNANAHRIADQVALIVGQQVYLPK